jgi:hypothetical protein
MVSTRPGADYVAPGKKSSYRSGLKSSPNPEKIIAAGQNALRGRLHESESVYEST